MTVTAVNYAKTLHELSVPAEAVQTTKEIFREVPGLKESLANPLVPFEAKSRVIDRVIPDEMKNFIKVACKHRNISLLEEIFEDYEEICRRQRTYPSCSDSICDAAESSAARRHQSIFVPGISGRERRNRNDRRQKSDRRIYPSGRRT